MATAKQRAAAKKNVKKAQSAWREMTPRQRALAQPQGRARKRPGAGGGKKRYSDAHINKMAEWRTLSRFVERLHREWWQLERSYARVSEERKAA